MLHTEESKDFKAYNSWNFSEAHLWDSIKEGFWFSSHTSLLFQTNTFTIGTGMVDRITIGMIPETTIQVDKNVTDYLFDMIPYEWQDIELKKIIYLPNTNVDRDSYVPIMDIHDGEEPDFSTIAITIDFDFTQRYYKI